MKNFFKKLALVLALALVVTVVAPAAASKSEAASVALNATKKTIGVGSSYDFNIKNKVKGSTYKWTSDNTKVAAVNAKNGVVTAKAAGTAKVSVKITLPNKTTKTLTATVTVKKYVDATAVAISNPTKEIKLGASYDFNRTMTPATANNKTYWVVKDAAGKEVANTKTGVGADIMTSAGVFKPAAAGEYTITAECWRSKTATVKRAESEALKVKVIPDFAVKQTKEDAFEIVYASDMSKVLKPANFKVENTATHAPYAVKEIKFSKDGKTATVIMFTNFVDKAEYEVTYTNGSVSATDKFVASIGTVDHIVIKTQTVVAATPTTFEYALVDANGIDVTKTYDINNRVNVEAKTTSGYLAGDGKLTLFATGNTAEMTVTYHTYTFDATGKENVIVQKGVVTAVDATAVTVTGVKYTLAATEPADWSNFTAKTAVPAGTSTNLQLYIENSEGKEETGLVPSYQSSNPEVLNINASTGALYAVKEGSAFIIVTVEKNNVKYQYSLPVTVTAKSQATTLVLTPASVTLSNTVSLNDSKDVKVVVKDQYGNEMDAVTPTVTPLARPKDVNDTDALKVVAPASGKVTVKGTNGGPLTKGNYTFKVSAKIGTNEVVAVLSVTLNQTSGETDVYQVVKEFDTIDTTFAKDLTSTKANELATALSTGYAIKVANYNGAAIKEYDTSALYRVTNSKGEVVFSDDLTSVDSGLTAKTSDFFANTTGVLTVKGIKLETKTVTKLAEDTYVVTVYANSKAVKQTVGFSVVDNQEVINVLKKENEVTKASASTLADVIAKAFTKNDATTAIAKEDVKKVVATTSTGKLETAPDTATPEAGNTLVIESVDLETEIQTYKITVTCPVNVTVEIK